MNIPLIIHLGFRLLIDDGKILGLNQSLVSMFISIQHDKFLI